MRSGASEASCPESTCYQFIFMTMQNEIYIIAILLVWALGMTAMCVHLVKANWDRETENDKLRLERNFFKAECEKRCSDNTKGDSQTADQ